MRKDIDVSIYKIGGESIKINVSAVARDYNCCWLTADKRIHPEKYPKVPRKERKYHTILEPYKEIIKNKIETRNIPATGIYDLLKSKYDYKGSYSTVKNFVSKHKKEIENNLTIRFNTVKGYQSQVDWKENLKLHNKDGDEYVVNIFLMVLGYSRYKYIELTADKTSDTLFRSLTNAFEYFKGTTETILFDNMKTIVDHTKSSYGNLKLNTSAEIFAKDAGFKIITCKPYTPKTKGKVETLAKIMNRLKAYDYEFIDWDELNNIVKKLLYKLNYEEKSQATNEYPINRYKKEKEYLIPINTELLKTHYTKVKLYKVTKESMILYKGKKYSVPTYYVGKCLSVTESTELIQINYNTELVNAYNKKNTKKLNYKKDDYLDIMNQSIYKDKSYDEIEEITYKNINSLDETNIEEE